MKYYFFNDKNLSIMDKEQVKGFMLLREEVIIRLFTIYGCIDLSYDTLPIAVDDYQKISEGLRDENIK